MYGQKTNFKSKIECPICGAEKSHTITLDTEAVECPNCGVMIVIEFDTKVVNIEYRDKQLPDLREQHLHYLEVLSLMAPVMQPEVRDALKFAIREVRSILNPK